MSSIKRSQCVKHQARLHRLAPLCLLRLPLHLQGRAERAAVAGRRSWNAHALSPADCPRRVTGRRREPLGAPCAHSAGCLPLALTGHVGAAAHAVPASDRSLYAPQRSPVARVALGPSLRRLILKPRKIAVKGARYARVPSGTPWTASLDEDSAAPIGRMAQNRALVCLACSPTQAAPGFRPR